MRNYSERLDALADRVDGAFPDKMVVSPTDALELTKALASKIVGFSVYISEFELALFGLPPPSPPASQPIPDEQEGTSPNEPPPLKLDVAPASSVTTKRQREEEDGDGPDSKKKRTAH